LENVEFYPLHLALCIPTRVGNEILRHQIAL